MQVESIGWEFDVLQANQIDDTYPRLEAVFNGITPAIAYDVNNQPKFTRNVEHKLKDLEKGLRQTHQADLSRLGSDDLAQNLAIITAFVTAYRDALEATILVPGQLELESLTIAGEWLLQWNQQSPLAQQKAQEREPMPSFNQSNDATPAEPTTTDTPVADDGHPDDPYMPV